MLRALAVAERARCAEAAGSREYTPQQTAGYSDEELGRIFTEGNKPAGSPFLLANGRGLLPDEPAADIFARFHAWPLAAETRVGVIAYLRSLRPKALVLLDSGGAQRKQPEAGR